jgi:hypothetical protein
MYIIFF